MAEPNPVFVPPGTARPLYGLWAAVVLFGAITVLRLGALAFYKLDLYPDEAQYWSWSRDLAWGYFSKPPVIAWLIAASTAVCGSGEGCIKASIPLVYFVASLLIYGIGRRLYGGRVGLLAALAFITLPGVSFSAAVASTDPPLLACWALALYALVRLAQGDARGWTWWTVLGAAIGFGLLSKYAMAFFVVGFVAWIVFDGEARRRLALTGAGWARPAFALVLGALIYLPNLYWNTRSGFVTFAHTGANANLRGALFHPGELVEFLVGQFAVFGPILFATLLVVLVRLGRWRADWRTRLFAAFVLPMLGTITVLALLSRANANWAAPVYVAGCIWVTAVLVEQGRLVWLGASFALHGVVAATLLVAPMVQSGAGVYAGVRVPRAVDPYLNYDGWHEIGRMVSDARRRFPGIPVVSDERKLTAELLYYVRPWPDDLHAWFADGRVSDHFKLTRPLRDVPGGDYLLVSAAGVVAHLSTRFRDFAEVDAITVPIMTGRTRTVRVFLGRGFLGYKTPRPAVSSETVKTPKGQPEP